MKSAYELAMERLRQKDGADRTLSAEQRTALAEVDRVLTAKLAELEIMRGQDIAAAQAAGDAEKAAELRRQLAAEIARSRSRAEADKDEIRRGGA